MRMPAACAAGHVLGTLEPPRHAAAHHPAIAMVLQMATPKVNSMIRNTRSGTVGSMTTILKTSLRMHGGRMGACVGACMGACRRHAGPADSCCMCPDVCCSARGRRMGAQRVCEGRCGCKTHHAVTGVCSSRKGLSSVLYSILFDHRLPRGVLRCLQRGAALARAGSCSGEQPAPPCFPYSRANHTASVQAERVIGQMGHYLHTSCVRPKCSGDAIRCRTVRARQTRVYYQRVHMIST